ncbi:TA system VapC family ribonuclease toxin [Arvimicrobium flavum]|uniref:TA system VapC family ribonuclease toxin n=1 Tax=Arvimicrobium flavum TaxID=3393320 RepID=UPI00237C1F92|nr:TA system VapC family ribonuclease toxin [Mesorhizobium shangrilense]
MTFLLDVNVLIALIDPLHVAHDISHAWFEQKGHKAWATCPITENGVIRIVGSSRYQNSPGSPAAVAAMVRQLRSLPGHAFWSDDISLIDYDALDTDRILLSSQVTDTYLLALAQSNGGQLATLDRRLLTTALSDGSASLHMIGGH